MIRSVNIEKDPYGLAFKASKYLADSLRALGFAQVKASKGKG